MQGGDQSLGSRRRAGQPAHRHGQAVRRFFGGGNGELEPTSTQSTTWYLPLDIVDTNNAYVVKAAVPGFALEDVDVTYTDGVLSISARRKEESTSKQGTYLSRELRTGNYVRSVQLPGGIRPEDIKASFESGILTVEIPKAPGPQAIKIQVGGKSEKSEKQPVGANSEK